MKRFLPILLVLGFLTLSCKNKSIEGVYSFDKKTTLEQYSKMLDSLPEHKKQHAQTGYNTLQALSIMLRLGKGGKAELTVSLKLFGKRKEKVYPGTWIQKGNNILVTTERQRLKGKKVEYFKQTISCDFKPGNLSCSGTTPGQANKQRLYFSKT